MYRFEFKNNNEEFDQLPQQVQMHGITWNLLHFVDSNQTEDDGGASDVDMGELG